MDTLIAVGDTPPCMHLSGRLGIADVADARPVLIDAIARNPHLRLNLAEIDMLDDAGMQLLIHCKRNALARGHRLELVAHSGAVLELLELFNLGGVFGDPILLPACADEGSR